jgi:hypothetical protein
MPTLEAEEIREAELYWVKNLQGTSQVMTVVKQQKAGQHVNGRISAPFLMLTGEILYFQSWVSVFIWSSGLQVICF